MFRRPPRSPLFPYPPLSRSIASQHAVSRLGPPQQRAELRVDAAERMHVEQAREEHHRECVPVGAGVEPKRSEEHTSELQSRLHLVCRLLLEKKKQHVVKVSA